MILRIFDEEKGLAEPSGCDDLLLFRGNMSVITSQLNQVLFRLGEEIHPGFKNVLFSVES